MKYHPHGSVLFVTFSIEQGLLLLNNMLGHLIVTSCLAQAQHHHPVKICHLLVEATHVHMVLVVDNPEDVPSFIGRFKTESAHYINRLLGRRKRTVWCEGYDSPVVLSFARALIAITYLYANPGKDNLTENIDTYPGFSTWKMFRTRHHERTCKRISRRQFTFLPRDSHNPRGYTKKAREIDADAGTRICLRIEPDAWIHAFADAEASQIEQINNRVVERVRILECRADRLRKKNNKTVIGRARLMNQSFDTSFLSRRSGKRMCCLSEKRSLRVRFIRFFKELMRRARSVRIRWAAGDVAIPYPPGLHPPSVPRLANVLSIM